MKLDNPHLHNLFTYLGNPIAIKVRVELPEEVREIREKYDLGDVWEDTFNGRYTFPLWLEIDMRSDPIAFDWCHSFASDQAAKRYMTVSLEEVLDLSNMDPLYRILQKIKDEIR